MCVAATDLPVSAGHPFHRDNKRYESGWTEGPLSDPPPPRLPGRRPAPPPRADHRHRVPGRERKDTRIRWLAAAGVRQQLNTLAARKQDLETRIAAAEAARQARPLLHPGMAKLYRDYVIEAREGLVDPERHAASAVALRSMIEEVVLTPEGDKLGIVLQD